MHRISFPDPKYRKTSTINDHKRPNSENSLCRIYVKLNLRYFVHETAGCVTISILPNSGQVGEKNQSTTAPGARDFSSGTRDMKADSCRERRNVKVNV